MTLLRTLSPAALFLALAPAFAWPQALTSITSVYVSYNSRRVSANPTGELKARLDSLDREMVAANSGGRMGELRRLLAKGNALLSGKSWTDSAEFSNSLLLRSDRVVVESQRPYTVRLEQLYAPATELSRPLSAHPALISRATGTPGQPATLVKELKTIPGVSRDLRESPQLIDLDLRDVADGRYVVVVEVSDSTRMIGSAALGIAVRKGVDETVSRLESEAKRAPEDLRAEILYPVDRMRNVNRGRLELRTFDVERDFAAAEAAVAGVNSGKDPFAGRTGDIKRHYESQQASEILPYRLLVPASYSPARSYPVVVALHGLGGTEDSFFEAYGRKLPELAEQRGYIILAPLGYRVDGQYGWGLGTPPKDPSTSTTQRLSEDDVMQTLARVRRLYNIDSTRIYLMGHSMGAIGTWKIAAKYPALWAGLGAFSGRGAPATAEAMKHIPQFVVHGDADPTVDVAGSRAMVAALKALNAEVVYVEVPGGNHGNVVEPNFGPMFDFFDAHRKAQPQD